MPLAGLLFSIAIAGNGLAMALEAIIDKDARPFIAVFLCRIVAPHSSLAVLLVIA